jgi:hypothetical protein
MIRLLLPVLSIFTVTWSAPFTDRLGLPVDTPSVNVAFDRTASLNASSLGHHDRCDSSRTQNWQAYAFLVEDCFVAVNQFYIEHVVRNPDEIFEFSASALRTHTRFPRVQTPDVYTHGKYHFLAGFPTIDPLNARKNNLSLTPESCTLAIVMLNWFQLGQLPGYPRYNPSSYDTSTSAELHKAAKFVENECLESPRRTPGWQPAGAHGNIGVFLWATDSDINRHVTGAAGFDLTNGSNVGVYDSVAR